jgi:hypothetical protein
MAQALRRAHQPRLKRNAKPTVRSASAVRSSQSWLTGVASPTAFDAPMRAALPTQTIPVRSTSGRSRGPRK